MNDEKSTVAAQLQDVVLANDKQSENQFLFDADRLREIASDAIVKRGVAYYREHRVISLDWEQDAVRALVQGSDPNSPYNVELFHDGDGELCVECECPFDWEPVCKHAVATLLSYASQFEDQESSDVRGAADLAIKDRAKRARTEVRVNHMSGEPWFGTWSATSVTPSSHYRRSYTVEIRSTRERANYCTCPDWESNQLGTCKHIEAVLHRLEKSAKRRNTRNPTPPLPFVYLSWDSGPAPEIRLRRSPTVSEELGTLLDGYFDPEGAFKGALPDGLFRFRDKIQGREDVLLGEDAILHAQKLAEDAARYDRGERIRREILNAGSRLPGIRARLYPYQVDGVAFLASRGRALLADDMGLGKTLQAISAAHWLRHNADVSRVLVVCPASLKHQWAREIERFTGDPASVIQGPPQVRAVQYRKGPAFLIVNYELILRDLTYINETVAPDLLILDEAQRIKNWRTKIASTIKLINSRYAFVLTGTPLENRLEELYSLMQVVDHRVLGPLWRYMIDFHVTNERDRVIGYRNLSELRRRMAPAMLRRDRSLVLEQLPARIEHRLDVPMTAKQKELHDSAMQSAAQYGEIAKRRPLTPVEQNRLMAALQQARMACDAAGLVDKKTGGSPKLDELAQLLEDLCLQDGLKAVVFSQWETMTAMVAEVARKLDIGFVRLHGGVPSNKRGELIDRFRDDDTTQVFISTDAGGVGLNLQSASVLINLDMPWNPAVLDQRVARVHRLGQPNKVQVILMVAADSYEERVAELVSNKRDLFDNVIDPNATEDVVGVDKKLLDTLLADLEETKAESASDPAESEAATPEPTPNETKASGSERVVDDSDNAAVRQTITDLQAAFGPRIEQILGMRGGLLVVVDQIRSEMEAVAEDLSCTVPVALIEPRTLAGLRRLGAASPLGESRTWFDARTDDGQEEVPPPLAMARKRLEAGQTLIEQGQCSTAMELLASGMVTAAAFRAGLSAPPPLAEVPVWIYSEGVTGAVVSPAEGTAIVRAVSLGSAPEVPAFLANEVLADARQIIESSLTDSPHQQLRTR